MADGIVDVGYQYKDEALNHSHAYLLPALKNEITMLDISQQSYFDLGCGNGSVAAALAVAGWDVTGIDISPEGIANANAAYPQLKLEMGSVYDDLAAKYGTFPLVVSLEVVEHLYDPRKYMRTLDGLLKPGGVAIISTPYHGYWKNLALALSGKMDKHFTALWDNGHIKFWSIDTLTKLIEESGLTVEKFVRVGRIPPLAKSMIAVARKPLVAE